MKKVTLLILVISTLVLSSAYVQEPTTTTQDYKDQVVELIKANPPLSNHKNYCFFNFPLAADLLAMTGKELTKDEKDHLLMYGYDVFTNDMTQWRYSVMNTVDLRAVTKISTTRQTGTMTYYTINVYVEGSYHAQKNTKGLLDTEWSHESIVGQFPISIADNQDAALKIKKALIKICESYGIKVKDGDNL